MDCAHPKALRRKTDAGTICMECGEYVEIAGGGLTFAHPNGFTANAPSEDCKLLPFSAVPSGQVCFLNIKPNTYICLTKQVGQQGEALVWLRA